MFVMYDPSVILKYGKLVNYNILILSVV